MSVNKEERKRKDRKEAASRRALESLEAKEIRLAKVREDKAKKLQKETSEDKEKRLLKRREQYKKNIQEKNKNKKEAVSTFSRPISVQLSSVQQQRQWQVYDMTDIYGVRIYFEFQRQLHCGIHAINSREEFRLLIRVIYSFLLSQILLSFN